jgi:hypothetical protein
MKTYYTYIIILLASITAACEKKIDLKLKPAQEQFVVEGYINNLLPQYNYVILSRSQDYFAPEFNNIPVSNAIVTITEGTASTNAIIWDTANKVTLTEINSPLVPAPFRKGVYFDNNVFTNPSQSLKGNIGKYYLLEILYNGNKYTAATKLVQPTVLDSLSYGFPFMEDGLLKYRLTSNYKDPDTIGNRQFYFWEYNENRNSFGWGALTRSRAPGKDDVANGSYIRLTHPFAFEANDTVNYYLTSINTDTYQFWDSFNKARDNNGPFATPVNFGSTISGPNAVGCFSGYSISSKTIILR